MAKYSQIQAPKQVQTPARSSSRLTAPTPVATASSPFSLTLWLTRPLNTSVKSIPAWHARALLVGAWLEFTSNQAAAR
ncbi:hypothetical protein A0H81_14376 [Grifola frondosa]|uniref:Uncharacterized protein n=1 Tax=Grifola frondosa TaxID=5627 RepID=A0A1C7LLI1_GRIFR|nr:hypothetical protein A0H81_14376 [Grifola frondosa]